MTSETLLVIPRRMVIETAIRAFMPRLLNMSTTCSRPKLTENISNQANMVENSFKSVMSNTVAII